jgi:hypothetical protein
MVSRSGGSFFFGDFLFGQAKRKSLALGESEKNPLKKKIRMAKPGTKDC